MKIGIIGLGLIGGSLAKTLKKRTDHTVLGMDMSQKVMQKAKLLEVTHGPLTEESIPECDMLIIATWPEGAVEYVRSHAAVIKKGATVLDVCGVKRAICEPLWDIARENDFLFVGGHPMAGVEHSGLEYATDTMFDRASMILTPPRGSDIQTLARLKKFFLDMGFGQVVITTPEEHDQVIAYTSQLPHVVASAYVRSPLMLGHHGFSAGSFRDMSRVASVDENLWTQLFQQNREPLLEELNGLIDRLTEYRDALRDGQEDTLRGLLREGRERKTQTEQRGKKHEDH